MEENIRNRNYILEKVYDITTPTGAQRLNRDVTDLTMNGARLGIVTNGRTVRLTVYCKMDYSVVHNLAIELGFLEF